MLMASWTVAFVQDHRSLWRHRFMLMASWTVAFVQDHRSLWRHRFMLMASWTVAFVQDIEAFGGTGSCLWSRGLWPLRKGIEAFGGTGSCLWSRGLWPLRKGIEAFGGTGSCLWSRGLWPLRKGIEAFGGTNPCLWPRRGRTSVTPCGALAERGDSDEVHKASASKMPHIRLRCLLCIHTPSHRTCMVSSPHQYITLSAVVRHLRSRCCHHTYTPCSANAPHGVTEVRPLRGHWCVAGMNFCSWELLRCSLFEAIGALRT